MLQVQNLSVTYRGVLALDSVSLSLASRELVGLIGPNGAGKSTLIKAILGLLPIASGRILLEGKPLRQQRRRIAYVPQRSQIDWDYPITAWNVVMMAQTVRVGWLRNLDRQAFHQTCAALDRVEMYDLRHRQIGELSGGQQQRIFLARALAQQADLLLLDEPFTAIDKKTEAIMLNIFADLQAVGKSLLICSHEWGNSLNRYDRLLLLNRQLIANDTPQSVMTLENIQRAYGTTHQTPATGQAEVSFFC